MRKLILTVLAAALLAGGSAFAQQEDTYAGASLGFASAGGTAFSIAFHGGVDNLITQNIGVRGDLSVLVAGGTAFGLGVNALYKDAVDTTTPVEVYGGAGPRILVSGGNAFFGFGALGGAEYMIADQIGLFGELRVDLNFGGPALFGLGLGANYHF